MQEGDVVLGLFLPTDEEATKAVHPTVRALHHPAAGAEARFAFERDRFFTPGADVGGEAELGHDVAHFPVVIAFVQTQPLGCSAVGSGRGTTTLSRVSRVSFMSCRLAPATAKPTGTPCPSVSRLRLTPALPRSVGLGPVFFHLSEFIVLSDQDKRTGEDRELDFVRVQGKTGRPPGHRSAVLEGKSGGPDIYIATHPHVYVGSLSSGESDEGAQITVGNAAALGITGREKSDPAIDDVERIGECVPDLKLADLRGADIGDGDRESKNITGNKLTVLGK